MQTRQLWLANDLQLTNGIRNVNGSLAGMQMYAKQIRYGRKQTSIFFCPSQPSRRRELTWCLRRTPNWCKGISAWGWIMSGRGRAAGKPEQLGPSVPIPTMWQSWGPGRGSRAAAQRATRRANHPDAPAGKNCFTIWNLCSLIALQRGGGEARCGHMSNTPPCLSSC